MIITWKVQIGLVTTVLSGPLDNPVSQPTYDSLTDVSSRVMGFSADQQLTFSRLSSHSASLTLDNSDGAFTPSDAGGTGTYASNASGWYGSLIRITASIGEAEGVVFVGLVDDVRFVDDGLLSVVEVQAVDTLAPIGRSLPPDDRLSTFQTTITQEMTSELKEAGPLVLPDLGQSSIIVEPTVMATGGPALQPPSTFGDSTVADAFGTNIMPAGISLLWSGTVDGNAGVTVFRPNIVGPDLQRNAITYSEFESSFSDVAALPLDGDLTNNGDTGSISISSGTPAFTAMPLPSFPDADGCNAGWLTSNSTLDGWGGYPLSWCHALLVPSGLSTSTRYALWKNGGATNGQGMYLQAQADGTIRVSVVSVVSSTVADYAQHDLPGPGTYQVGARITNNDISLYVDGVRVARTFPISTTPVDGSDDPGFSPGLRSVETDTSDLTIIDGSGIVVSHFLHRESLTATDVAEHYRLLFMPETSPHTFEFTDGTITGAQLRYRELDVGWNTDDRINTASITSVRTADATPPQTAVATNSTSLSDYGASAYRASECYHRFVSEIAGTAEQWVNVFGDVSWTPRSLSTSVATMDPSPASSAEQEEITLLLDMTGGLWNRVDITHTLTGGTSQTSQCMIVGRRINATPDDTSLTLSLVPAADFQTFVLGDADFGVLDQNRLGI